MALVLLFALALRRLRPTDLGSLGPRLLLDLAGRFLRDRGTVLRIVEPRPPRRGLRDLGLADYNG